MRAQPCEMYNSIEEPDAGSQLITMDSDSPLSPRMIAIATLKRAASLREGAPTPSNASPASTLPPRAAGLARPAVLERSASDAARRLAMAKLTGEKVTGPMIMPTIPLPSLAHLQARHEQKAATGMLFDFTAGDSSSAVASSHNRSASASTANSALHTLVTSSTALKRSASANSSKRSLQSPNLPHPPNAESLRTGLVDRDVTPETSASQLSYVDQRQEARSNLIRKLSRGRQATGAAAAERERATQRDAVEGHSTLTNPVGNSNTELPLNHAGGENRCYSESAMHTKPSPIASTQQGSPQSPSTAIATTAISPSKTLERLMRRGILSPESANSSSRTGKEMYAHIPIPPVPATPDTAGSADSPAGRSGPTHASVYSATSEFRPYRHTYERDRDSAIARMHTEDDFEFEDAENSDDEGMDPPHDGTAYKSGALHMPTPRSGLNSAVVSPFDFTVSPVTLPVSLPGDHIDGQQDRSSVEQQRLIEDLTLADWRPPLVKDSIAATAEVRSLPVAGRDVLRDADPVGDNVRDVISPQSFGSTLETSPTSSPQSRFTHNVASVQAATPPAPIKSQHLALDTDSDPSSYRRHRAREENASTDSFPVSVSDPRWSRQPLAPVMPPQAADSVFPSSNLPTDASRPAELRKLPPVAPLNISALRGKTKLDKSLAAAPNTSTTASPYGGIFAQSQHSLGPSLQMVVGTCAGPGSQYRFPTATQADEDFTSDQMQSVSKPVRSHSTAPRPHVGTLDLKQNRDPDSVDVQQASYDVQRVSPPLSHRLPGQIIRQQIVKDRINNLIAAITTSGKSTGRPEAPRKIIVHSPVLQVVNSNTVKDRYLFLFSDILVIAKPLIEESADGLPKLPGLETRFSVKSIVELVKLKLVSQQSDPADDQPSKKKHPLLATFVERFAIDPKKSISALTAKAGLSSDPATIANLLFRNPELNRSQLGSYLSGTDQKAVLKAYCERFKLSGIRIEDALRVFVSSVRLPYDYAAAEHLLSVFAAQWLLHNPGTGMTNDPVFATKLVVAMMELNDALHSGINDETAAAGNLFSFPNHAITVGDFIAAFRLKDPHGSLPDEHLTRIYVAISKDRLQQAADNSSAATAPEGDAIFVPAKLPNRLTYGLMSESISITLPSIDPQFSIRLIGQDLKFDPPLLTFDRCRTATFRVKPTALGNKTMLFIKNGSNGSFYRNVPINKTFAVERAFMSHTFQIAFVNHLGVKRKYLFSMADVHSKLKWLEALRFRIETPSNNIQAPRELQVAAAVSLQVLRDSLITPEEPVPVLSKTTQLRPRSGLHSPPGSRAGLRSAGGLHRSNSVSKTYAHGAGRAELELQERRPSNTPYAPSLLSVGASIISNGGRRGSREEDKIGIIRTGHEIVTSSQQNSLLPLVLGLVATGTGHETAMPAPTAVASRHRLQGRAPAPSAAMLSNGHANDVQG